MPYAHRHCERSEAIQNPAGETRLDCFASLAMTAENGDGGSLRILSTRHSGLVR